VLAVNVQGAVLTRLLAFVHHYRARHSAPGLSLGGRVVTDNGDGKVGSTEAVPAAVIPLVLHLTAMSSIHDPMETSSTHASPPATDHDTENLNSDDDEPSKVSNGGNLRVRNFLVSPAATELTTNGTSRATSRARSREPSISRENSPSARLSRRRPSPVYTSKGSA
jgi:hypothetical protein